MTTANFGLLMASPDPYQRIQQASAPFGNIGAAALGMYEHWRKEKARKLREQGLAAMTTPVNDAYESLRAQRDQLGKGLTDEQLEAMARAQAEKYALDRGMSVAADPNGQSLIGADMARPGMEALGAALNQGVPTQEDLVNEYMTNQAPAFMAGMKEIGQKEIKTLDDKILGLFGGDENKLQGYERAMEMFGTTDEDGNRVKMTRGDMLRRYAQLMAPVDPQASDDLLNMATQSDWKEIDLANSTAIRGEYALQNAREMLNMAYEDMIRWEKDPDLSTQTGQVDLRRMRVKMWQDRVREITDTVGELTKASPLRKLYEGAPSDPEVPTRKDSTPSTGGESFKFSEPGEVISERIDATDRLSDLEKIVGEIDSKDLSQAEKTQLKRKVEAARSTVANREKGAVQEKIAGASGLFSQGAITREGQRFAAELKKGGYSGEAVDAAMDAARESHNKYYEEEKQARSTTDAKLSSIRNEYAAPTKQRWTEYNNLKEALPGIRRGDRAAIARAKAVVGKVEEYSKTLPEKVTNSLRALASVLSTADPSALNIIPAVEGFLADFQAYLDSQRNLARSAADSYNNTTEGRIAPIDIDKLLKDFGNPSAKVELSEEDRRKMARKALNGSN